jgi:hypothetical protein
MTDAFVLGGMRTPTGRYDGSLSHVHGELGGIIGVDYGKPQLGVFDA